MLRELHIENFALIDNMTVDFSDGLNILTGETGAGKSIVIDAINVLLGDRAGTDLVRSGAERAILQAVFEVDDSPIVSELAEIGIEPEDGLIIIYREVAVEGRNIARINGRTCPVNVLRQAGELLVDLHGQHEHQSLLHEEAHIGFLDAAGDETLLKLKDEMADLVRQRNVLLTEIRDLATGERDRQRAIDLLNYQIEEISRANLQPNEDEILMAEKMRLANAEKLHSAASEVYDILYEGNDGHSAMDMLGAAISSLSGVIRFDPALQPALDNLESAMVQVQDVCHEVGDYCESVQFDPDKLQEIDDRLVMINNLRRKYGSSVEEILAFYDEKVNELEKITHHEERVSDAQKRLVKLELKVVDAAVALSDKRFEISYKLAKDIEAELAELGMPHAKFVINISHDLNEDGIEINGGKVAVKRNGIDKVAFMISANIGEVPRPLAKIASGGEISRIMLALKSVAHRGTGVPTLIFDEVDSGIGGRTAEVVGMKLMKAARAVQIICVTHLAQIALYGDRHFSIEKKVVNERTVSTMRAMNEEERVHELARLQAGGRISDAVIIHIRDAMRDIAEQKATV